MHGHALALGLLLVWLTLSMASASDRSLAWTQAKAWYVAAASFFLVANAMASPRNVRMLVLAFVIGALVRSSSADRPQRPDHHGRRP